jgi:hypothetical protein
MSKQVLKAEALLCDKIERVRIEIRTVKMRRSKHNFRGACGVLVFIFGPLLELVLV